jgi:ferredoxin
MVGCSTCAMVCPTEAISFPSREIVRKLEKEFKIFKTLHLEAGEKREKAAAMSDRQKAEENRNNTSTDAKVRIAGSFGEKRFLMQLEEFAGRKDCDIANLQLHIPTVKGMMHQASAYMDFELVSTTQEDILPFLDELKALTAKNHLVWAGES